MKLLAYSIAFAVVAHAQTPEEGRGVVIEPVPSVRKQSNGLLIGGGVAFGTIYLVNVVAALSAALAAGSLPVVPSETSSLGLLFVPLVGPFLALSNSRNHAPGIIAVLLVDGLAQLASATLLTWGVIAKALEPPTFSWLMLPGAAGAPVGATFALRWP